ncbi:hypothetical protein Taro_040822, partial [Colocasia esculenta]|nr:hypothetical protein [Colocasia esculenta]
SVAAELPVATVIRVATALCVAFLSRPVNGSRQGGRRDKVRIATPRPVAFWGLEAKSLGRLSLSLLWLFLLSLLLSEGESFPLSDSWSLVASAARVELGSGVVERGGGGRGFVKAPLGVWFSKTVVATPGCSIPAVRLPTDVATAERVATSEKALPRLDATLSRRGWPDTWLFLPDLVEVRDVGAYVVGLWSHVVAPVFRRDSLSQEFVVGRSWWRFVAPCVASSVS